MVRQKGDYNTDFRDITTTMKAFLVLLSCSCPLMFMAQRRAFRPCMLTRLRATQGRALWPCIQMSQRVHHTFDLYHCSALNCSWQLYLWDETLEWSLRLDAQGPLSSDANATLCGKNMETHRNEIFHPSLSRKLKRCYSVQKQAACTWACDRAELCRQRMRGHCNGGAMLIHPAVAENVSCSYTSNLTQLRLHTQDKPIQGSDIGVWKLGTAPRIAAESCGTELQPDGWSPVSRPASYLSHIRLKSGKGECAYSHASQPSSAGVNWSDTRTAIPQDRSQRWFASSSRECGTRSFRWHITCSIPVIAPRTASCKAAPGLVAQEAKACSMRGRQSINASVILVRSPRKLVIFITNNKSIGSKHPLRTWLKFVHVS